MKTERNSRLFFNWFDVHGKVAGFLGEILPNTDDKKERRKGARQKYQPIDNFPKVFSYLFLEHFHLLSTVVKLHDYMQSPTDRARKILF